MPVCDGLLDQTLMEDPFSYFVFQPVFHNWCKEGHGMCYCVCGMVHIKEHLLLIGKSSPYGVSGFPPSLSDSLPYDQLHITITKMCSVLPSCSSQCSMTGVTKAMVCVILSVGWCI